MAVETMRSRRSHPSRYVLGLRDWFQVVGVDADPVTAEVVELQPFGDRATQLLPDPAMRLPSAAVLTYVAVASGADLPEPEPAPRVRLHDPRPGIPAASSTHETRTGVIST